MAFYLFNTQKCIIISMQKDASKLEEEIKLAVRDIPATLLKKLYIKATPVKMLLRLFLRTGNSSRRIRMKRRE